VVFDQSVFVKLAIKNVSKEALIGLVLTGVMILVFLGSPRAIRGSAFRSALRDGGLSSDRRLYGRLHQHHDSGRAGAGLLPPDRRRRVVLENIFRYMEMGESASLRRRRAEHEVSMAVLAATFTTSIVFFPVTFFTGVSKYIFTPTGAGRGAFDLCVVLLRHDRGAALLRQIHPPAPRSRRQTRARKAASSRASRPSSTKSFRRMLNWYEVCAKRAMERPGLTAAGILGGVVVLLVVFPSSAAPIFRAPIQANSSSTCACPAARVSK
jgi:HAE1 family hydrophobic/amphiphilic exporter-1